MKPGKVFRALYGLMLEKMTREGSGVVNFIDVGSAGSLPFPWREHRGSILHRLNFEPRGRPDRNPHVVTVDVALWEEDCERDFYVCGGVRGQGSSLFPQNYDYVRENFEQLRLRGPKRLAETWFERSKLDGVERVTCRRLDDVLEELNHPFQYHFLKVDSQGAEYEILRGAGGFLRESCLGLQLELFTIPLYEGIRLLPDVVEYLDGLGFDLVVRFSAHGTFDSQHDCVFLKRSRAGEVMDAIKRIYNLV